MVTKRYAAWDRGEHDREWEALTLLHLHAPGLAPEPLSRTLVDGAPVLEMSRVPGEPLGGVPLTSEQTAGLAVALDSLHGSIPKEALGAFPERRSGPTDIVTELREWIDEPLNGPVSKVVAASLDQARVWLGSAEVDGMTGPLAERVFSHADGNLGNLLWDGERCRIVDFEDAGVSDPAYEVADLLEHVTVWLNDLVPADDLVPLLGFPPDRLTRLLGFRRLFSVFWLLMLLPGNPGHHRNPEGTVERQAERVMGLLGHVGTVGSLA